MNLGKEFLLINNIKLPVNASESEAFSVARNIIKKTGLSLYDSKYSIYRRSIDARKKPDIFYVYSVAITGDFSNVDEDKISKFGITLCKTTEPDVIYKGDIKLSASPVVVGSGPCGLFAALILAENGYNPILIERGGSITERHRSVELFNKTHILDTESNIQFGAGGAGTFSDGKLVTRLNDPLTNYVLERFIQFGAPEEIRYIAKPHIGTDVLSVVVDRMIEHICSLGGTILYHTKFISAKSKDGLITSIITNRGEINCGSLVLAIGHSARDTYEHLIKSNYSIEAKAFSVGMRIEHLASDIDYALYGKAANTHGLGHAEYALSHNTKERGTYTFCMCPGGVVVAAASEDGGLVVNGMSYNSRSERNSNSAVVTSIFKEDYGSSPLSAIDFQRKIERSAFSCTGGDYRAPIITVGDFLSDKCTTEPRRILPSYMSGTNVLLVHPKEYLPDIVCRGIKEALPAFDKKINGFCASDAVLTGVETRTSAPIRILRDGDTKLAIGYRNLYPAGEGAGYAGGITSAAIDGIKSAVALITRFKT